MLLCIAVNKPQRQSGSESGAPCRTLDTCFCAFGGSVLHWRCDLWCSFPLDLVCKVFPLVELATAKRKALRWRAVHAELLKCTFAVARCLNHAPFIYCEQRYYRTMMGDVPLALQIMRLDGGWWITKK